MNQAGDLGVSSRRCCRFIGQDPGFGAAVLHGTDLEDGSDVRASADRAKDRLTGRSNCPHPRKRPGTRRAGRTKNARGIREGRDEVTHAAEAPG